jgi:hypothetical protein
MLDVPAVNGRGKIYEDDFARFYPREHTADQIMGRLRKMVASGSHLAAANCRQCARQRGQAAAGATTTTPTLTVVPTPETDNGSNPFTPVIPLPI